MPWRKNTVRARLLRLATCLALVGCTVPDAAVAPPAMQPGAVLQSAPFPGAPAGASATRVVYATTGPNGHMVQVSGLVIVPDGPAPPAGRNVLAWLHPTTGVATDCAPTQGPDPFGQIQGLQDFLAAGDVVVATDYPGLGMPGVHPYLVGRSEAEAALDAVRAARHLPDAHAGARFAVWGHSQGGHAALFTAALAQSYAPDLHLVGVAAAAPVTDLTNLLLASGRNPLWGGLLSYAVWSWSRLFDAAPGTIVLDRVRPVVDRVAADCLQSGPELRALIRDSGALAGIGVAPDAHWQILLADNTPQPMDFGVPVYLAQGGADPVVPAPITRRFVNGLCRAGVRVRYDERRGVDHYTIAMRTAATAVAWIQDRFAGRPAADDCPQSR